MHEALGVRIVGPDEEAIVAGELDTISGNIRSSGSALIQMLRAKYSLAERFIPDVWPMYL